MKTPILDNLPDLTFKSVTALEVLLDHIFEKVRSYALVDGKVSGQKLEENQDETHGLAWIATYVESLRQMYRWSELSIENKKFGDIEKLILQISFGEYLTQIKAGIPMSQTEFIRLSDFGLPNNILENFLIPEVELLCSLGNPQVARKTLVN